VILKETNMATKTKSKTNLALNRLMGRLSALRLTLRKDERDLLDQFILGATVAEVEAHRLTEQPNQKANPKLTERVTPKASMRVTEKIQPEVVAHRLVEQPSQKANPKLTERVTPKTSMRVTEKIQPEVVAHSMVTKADKQVPQAAVARLDWDADKKQYRVTE
jgi:regulator of extracellular matrix RemA (YlzA/DUF370 family)